MKPFDCCVVVLSLISSIDCTYCHVSVKSVFQFSSDCQQGTTACLVPTFLQLVIVNIFCGKADIIKPMYIVEHAIPLD